MIYFGIILKDNLEFDIRSINYFHELFLTLLTITFDLQILYNRQIIDESE